MAPQYRVVQVAPCMVLYLLVYDPASLRLLAVSLQVKVHPRQGPLVLLERLVNLDLQDLPAHLECLELLDHLHQVSDLAPVLQALVVPLFKVVLQLVCL